MSFTALTLIPKNIIHLGYIWGVVKASLLQQSSLHDISPFLIIHNQTDYLLLKELSEYLHVQSKDIHTSPLYELYAYTVITITDWEITHPQEIIKYVII
jgi:hypothetical protein